MGNSVNLSAAGSEPLELQLTLSMFLPQRNFNTEQTRQHGDTMTPHCVGLYTTELLHSLSDIKYE